MAQSSKPVIVALVVVGCVAILLMLRGRGGSGSIGTDAIGPVPDSSVGAVDSVLAREPLGRFFYLMDVSGSVRAPVGPDPMRDAASLIPLAVEAFSGLSHVMPQEHVVGTIGTISLRQAPLCRIPVKSPTLFSKSDTSWYRRAVRQCVARVQKAAQEQYTDIRGAMDYAGQAIAGTREALRVMLVFSDLEEDLAPGQTPATPDLHGICVGIFAIITDSVARRPDLLRQRREQWVQLALKWGARDARSWTTAGFDAAELRRFAESCERRK